ncbi:MAG: site-2 protease family protein [Candidatus Amesbacteria bacterium]|nr:site-2 protease family protein [Candidatus Amesbacteria bacterium]
MLGLLFTSPFSFIVVFGGIILAIGIHEAAHCYMADYLGDPTPQALGRKTLNPLVHLDPLGTLMILVTGGFGWGKPAPYDPYNLANPSRDTKLIALAGPATNIIMAIILSLVFKTLHPAPLLSIFYFLISININLALFNLLPIPPLDGSKILIHNSGFINQHANYLLILAIIPIFGGHSIASIIISPISQFLLTNLL